MDKEEFDSRLEYRICRELSGMSERELRVSWCDGVMLGDFLLDDPEPRILGSAWIGDTRRIGGGQEQWRLELLLSQQFKSRDEIDWDSLLPADSVTKRLAIDLRRKFLQIEPAAAVADSA